MSAPTQNWGYKPLLLVLKVSSQASSPLKASFFALLNGSDYNDEDGDSNEEDGDSNDEDGDSNDIPECISKCLLRSPAFV